MVVRRIDVRDQPEPVDPSRRDALRDAARDVSDHVLPGAHRIRVESFDAATGNAAVVVSDAADAEPGQYVARALRHLQRIGPALGFGPSQAPEYVADPTAQETSTGAVAVHLRQHYKGIPVYDARRDSALRRGWHACSRSPGGPSPWRATCPSARRFRPAAHS